MELGSGSSFLKITRTLSPCATWMVGPGAEPLNPHTSIDLSGAICCLITCAVKRKTFVSPSIT
jgi:hypothetical protein